MLKSLAKLPCLPNAEGTWVSMSSHSQQETLLNALDGLTEQSLMASATSPGRANYPITVKTIIIGPQAKTFGISSFGLRREGDGKKTLLALS